MEESILLWQQMLGGGLGGRGWFAVALVTWLFVVVIFKPERILKLPLFKRAYLFLALSIMVPGISLVLMSPMSMFGGMTRARMSQTILYSIINAAGPVFLGLAVICGFAALVPRFIPPVGSFDSPTTDSPERE